jgi:hypothetical protein
MPAFHALRYAAASVLLLAAAPAVAFDCYAIVDRHDQVVYQSTQSPVDLSDAGAAARDALRARGDQLIAMNTDNCPAVDTQHIAGGSRPATVDEIVAGMRPALSYGNRVDPGIRGDASSGGIQLPAITVPRETSGPMSNSSLPSGMSIR